MTDLTKLLTLLRLLLNHIDVSDFLTVLLGFVLVTEIPEGARQQLIDGLNALIDGRELC